MIIPTIPHKTVSIIEKPFSLTLDVTIYVHDKKRTIRILEPVLQETLTRIASYLSIPPKHRKDSDLIKIAYYVSAANKECDTGLMVALNLVRALAYNGMDIPKTYPVTKTSIKKQIFLTDTEYEDSLELAAFLSIPTPKKPMVKNDQEQIDIIERDAKALKDIDAHMMQYLKDNRST